MDDVKLTDKEEWTIGSHMWMEQRKKETNKILLMKTDFIEILWFSYLSASLKHTHVAMYLLLLKSFNRTLEEWILCSNVFSIRIESSVIWENLGYFSYHMYGMKHIPHKWWSISLGFVRYTILNTQWQWLLQNSLMCYAVHQHLRPGPDLGKMSVCFIIMIAKFLILFPLSYHPPKS
jgi:hypothetical protein